MPRPPNPNPNRHIHTTLPPDLMGRVDILLWSESEGKVPQGAMQGFLTKLIREFFEHRHIDIGPFMDMTEMPGTHIVAASDQTLSKLINHLKKVPATTEGDKP